MPLRFTLRKGERVHVVHLHFLPDLFPYKGELALKKTKKANGFAFESCSGIDKTKAAACSILPHCYEDTCMQLRTFNLQIMQVMSEL